jgi:hypothetical protein
MFACITQRWFHATGRRAMRIKVILVLLLLIALIIPLSGCTDLKGAIAQTGAWRDQAATIQSTLDEQIIVMQSELAAIDPDSALAQHLIADIKLAQAKHASLGAAIAQADIVLKEVKQPTDPMTQIAQGVSAWVPAPIQGPLVLGAALIASLARSSQLKRTGTSIVNSIRHVLERDEQLKAIFASHADTIRSIQTPNARKLVDQVQNKRAMKAVSV